MSYQAIPHELLARVVALHQSGRLSEAEVLYKKLLAVDPINSEVLYLLGKLYSAHGKLEDAVQLIEQSISQRPNHYERHNEVGILCFKLGRYHRALERFNHVITLNPAFAQGYLNRGAVYYNLKQYKEAFADYDQAIKLNPGYDEAYYNRGLLFYHLKQYAEACESYDKAISINPHSAKFYNNRGNALRYLKKYDETLTSFDKAIALKPDYAEAYGNRGRVKFQLARYEEALSDLDKAIAIKPDYIEAIWNKACLKLLMGQYEEGWRLYECRWKKAGGNALRDFGKPLWLGHEDLKDKTILLCAEQGLGDTIQFCRYASFMEKLGAKVILEVQPALKSLVSTFKVPLTVISQGEPIPSFDFYCTLMSLPLACGTTMDTVPANIPYLYTDEANLIKWQKRLGKRTKPRIGLVWSGSVVHENDSNRSIPLRKLAPLLSEEYEFHSIQKDVRPQDREWLEEYAIITHGKALDDFLDTASLVNEMDLVISVDTSVAHLAGALGKKLWLLVYFEPDFRWMAAREDSPWYPTARLFRQPTIDDWDSVIQMVKMELSHTQW